MNFAYRRQQQLSSPVASFRPRSQLTLPLTLLSVCDAVLSLFILESEGTGHTGFRRPRANGCEANIKKRAVPGPTRLMACSVFGIRLSVCVHLHNNQSAALCVYACHRYHNVFEVRDGCGRNYILCAMNAKQKMN